MKKIFTIILIVILTFPIFGQGKDTIYVKTPIFEVVYSQKFQQPLKLMYQVKCPTGNAKRYGMDFFNNDTIITSDDEDYVNNVWDKGHLAPAAAFNCDRETLKLTFTYLNCALQHEGLNRGPWKELEGFERNLAKIFLNVYVIIDVVFDGDSEVLPTGAVIPTGFKKTILFDNKCFYFYFPNEDVSGIDWINFRINQ